METIGLKLTHVSHVWSTDLSNHAIGCDGRYLSWSEAYVERKIEYMRNIPEITDGH